MKEAKKKAAMDVKRTRKLNFNAPLLSTRHPGGFPVGGISRTNSQGTSRDTSTRVPFSWEQAPGKPKEDMGRLEADEDEELPPPPGRWHPPKEEEYQHYELSDDGCDADVDVFSDAIDMFSLSDALDHIVEAAEKAHGLDSLKLETLSGSESPNFIIQRFLPAAQALAASSALNVSNNLNSRIPTATTHPDDSAAQEVRRSYSPFRGCGLEIFFPWRMKHKLCGVKSPVRQCLPQSGGGKHRRNCSSA